jgi:hypothetical protein
MFAHGAHAACWGDCRAPPDQMPSSVPSQGRDGVRYKLIVLPEVEEI